MTKRDASAKCVSSLQPISNVCHEFRDTKITSNRDLQQFAHLLLIAFPEYERPIELYHI
jgi:hypothetical protein